MSKRFVSFIMLTFIIGVILVFVLTTCGRASLPLPPTPAADATPTVAEAAEEQTPVVIDMWYHSAVGSQREAVIEVIDNFNASHEYIEVVVIELPEGNYNEQVQAAAFGAAIAGDLPCLLDFDGPYVYNYVWNDFLIPLDDYVSPEMREDFLSSIIAQGTFQDGKLYSLGSFDAGLAVWGNGEYLESINTRIPTVDDPWTRVEFEEALRELQALPEVEHALDMKMNYGVGEWFTFGFSPILQSFGADLIDRTDYQSADGVLNGPQAVAAMEMVQGWVDKGYVDVDPEDDAGFAERRAALSWVGHWMANDYADALGEDLMLLPMPDFGHGPKTGMGSWNWAITTHCKNPEATWEVLEYILQPENIAITTSINRAIPARKSVLERSSLYGPGGDLHIYIEQIQAGWAVPRPITPAYPVITKAFAEAFNDIVRGGAVQAELDHAVRIIDRDIQEHEGYPLE